MTGYRKVLTVAIVLAVTITMVVTLFSTQISDESNAAVYGDGWVLDGGTLTVNKDNASGWDKTKIEKVVVADNVLVIGGGAFDGCNSLKCVIMPDTLTTISYTAFNNCIELEYVKTSEKDTNTNMPSGLKLLGDYAFQYCDKLKGDLVFSCKELSIGRFAFYKCNSLTSLTITGELSYIEDYTFQNTGLKTVKITGAGSTISEVGFAGCTSLTEVILPDTLTTIRNSTFARCSSLSTIKLPNSITTIEAFAFDGCSSLSTIKLPNSLITIGDKAFRNASLTEVILPDTLTTINEATFAGCTKLEKIKTNEMETESQLPSKLTTIRTSAFENCKKLSLNLSVSYKINISNRAFFGCTGLTGVEITGAESSIGESAFNGCTGLTSVKITGARSLIGNSAFYGCTSLNNVMITGDSTDIGISAFNGCRSLTTATLPNSLESIKSGMFNGCNLLSTLKANGTENIFPNNLTSIELEAFKNCYSLRFNLILNSKISIETSAFYGCTGLTGVEITGAESSIAASAFFKCTGLTSVEITGARSLIGNSAFEGCTGLANIIITGSNSTIGDSAFEGCTGLTSVTLPNTMETLGPFIFKGCTGLTSVTLPNTMETLGRGAFYGCTGLKTMMLPENITTIGREAFYGCSSPILVSVPGGLTTIDDYAFKECSILKSVKYNNNAAADVALYDIKYLGASAFQSCTAIETVSIWNLESCGANAFYYTLGLKTVIISNGLETVPNGIFSYCSDVTVYLPATVTSIDDSFEYGISSKMTVYLNSKNPNIGSVFNWSRNHSNTTIYLDETSSKYITDNKISGASVKYLSIAALSVNVKDPSQLIYNSGYALNGSVIAIPFGYEDSSKKSVQFDTFGVAYDTSHDYLNINQSSGKFFTVNLNINGTDNSHKIINIREKDLTNTNFSWHDNFKILTGSKEIESLGKPTSYSFMYEETFAYGDTFTFKTIKLNNENGLYYSYVDTDILFDIGYVFTINEYIAPSKETGSEKMITFKICQQPVDVVIRWMSEDKSLTYCERTIKSNYPIYAPEKVPDDLNYWYRENTGDKITNWNDPTSTRINETFIAVLKVNSFNVTVKYDADDTTKEDWTTLIEKEIAGPYALRVNNDELSLKSSDDSSFNVIFDFSSTENTNKFPVGKEFFYFHLDGNGREYSGTEEGVNEDRTIIIEVKDVTYSVKYTYINGDGDAINKKDWLMVDEFENHIYDKNEGASFTINYTIVKNPDEHGLKKKDGSYVLEIPLPTSKYYTCKGWTANESSTIQKNEITIYLYDFRSGPVSVNLYFYVGGYNIYFDYDDGSLRDSWGYADIGDNIIVPDKKRTIELHSKAGYEFKGEWNCAGKKITDEKFILTSEYLPSKGKDITITIVWVPREYQIQYGFNIEDSIDQWTATISKDILDEDPDAYAKLLSTRLIAHNTIKIGEGAFLPNKSLTDLKLDGFEFKFVWDIYDSEWNTTKGYFTDEDGLVLTIDNAKSYISGKYINVTPHFEKIKYPVILDRDDEGKSTGSFKNITASYSIGETIELPKRTDMNSVMLENKMFDHWSSTLRPSSVDKFTITQDDVKKIGDDDSFTFKIVWADMKYKISYDFNGGTGRSLYDLKTYKYNDPVDLPAYENYTKSGYTPIGWGLDRDGPAETITEFNDSMILAKDNNNNVTLYIVWEPMFYNITYFLDGGSIDLNAPKKGFEDVETNIKMPTKDGYVFAGWVPDTKSDFNSFSAKYWDGTEFVQWKNDKTVTSERFKNLCSEFGKTVTLNATWSAESYKIVFNLNGGISNSPIEDVITSLSDKNLTLPPMTGTKKGHTFAGWSLDKENIIENKGFTSNMANMADNNNTVTLYAVWSPIKYKIIFDDGTDYNKTMETLYGIGVDIGVPDKIGYVFSGWKGTTGSDAQYSNDRLFWYNYISGSTIKATSFKNLSDTADSTVTMTAEWTLAKYSIAYNANGAMGEVPKDNIKYSIGEKIEMLEASDEFKKSNGNKQFIGWSFDPKSTIPITLTEFTENLTAYSDMFNRINLYAIWVNGAYRATIDLGGATPSEIPAGWKLDSDGKYYKEVGEGSSMKDVLADWENVSLSMDGKVFKSWSYDSATVMGDVDVTPVFEDVNKMYMVIFISALAFIAIGAFLFTRRERRF